MTSTNTETNTDSSSSTTAPTGSTRPANFDAIELSPLQKAGEILFRLRDYTPIPIVLIALLSARPTLASVGAGMAVALTGEVARAYGVAFIGTISRTRSYSNGELVKSGPFSLLRNPLYFGNLVLSVGLSMMAGVWWLPLAVVAIFYAQYIPIVAWEEMKLTRIFGDRYLDYKREVPNRWFPRLAPLVSMRWAAEPINWAPAWKSEKRTLTSVIAFSVIMIILLVLESRAQADGEAVLPLVNFLFP
jgi:protein-S-isoprenylcysteine O-methyltransferase Ste14